MPKQPKQLLFGTQNKAKYNHMCAVLSTLTANVSNARISGAPLSALQIDPQTGKYLSELTWEERAALQMQGDAEVRAFIQTHFLPMS